MRHHTVAARLPLLALVVTGTALVIIDLTIVAIALPAIQADLGGTLADLQWVVVAYMITMGAVTQVAGSLSDGIGHRRMYLVGLALFTAASLACGAANTLVMIDVFRAVQGIGGAILMVNALPLLTHHFDGERRNLAISWWGTAATACGVAAPLLGGVLVDLLGWRATFLVNLPIGAVAFVVALRVLPADPPADPLGPRTGRRVDVAGALLLVAALLVGDVAVLRGEDQGWTSALTIAQAGTAMALFGVFLWLQTRTGASTLDISMFRRRVFSSAVLAIFMSRVLTIGGTVYLVQYLQETLELSPTGTGLLLAPVFIAQMVAGPVGGKLLSHIPPGVVIATGYAAKALGAAGLAVAAATTSSPWTLIAPLVVWGLGGGLAGAPVMAVAMNAVDKTRAGMAAGTIASLASIGAGIGTAALGAVYQSRLTAGLQDGSTAQAATGSAATVVLGCSAGLAFVTALVVLALVGWRRPQAPRISPLKPSWIEAPG